MRLTLFLSICLFTISCSETNNTTPRSDTSPEIDMGKDQASDTSDVFPDLGKDLAEDPSSGDLGGDANDMNPSDTNTEDVVDPDPGGVLLRADLREETMVNHMPLGYRIARDQMYTFRGIDDVGGRIEGIYSGRSVDTDGSRTPGGNCKKADGSDFGCSFNTEHSFAKVFLRRYLTEGSSEYRAAEGDIHHIFPSDQGINNERWHFAFGNTDCGQLMTCKINEESFLGLPTGATGSISCSHGDPEEGDSSCVMQVRDLRKGDIARAQFYMSVRYDMPIPEDSEQILREWNRDDLPDEREKKRNDRIERSQGNRNPFVDDPTLVDKIRNF